ncbi:MAG: thioesterase family protein, partial [Burkholderiales bacterium]
PQWIDYNGHLNVGYYHVAFDVAGDEFFDWLGMTRQFREQHGATTFGLEAHLTFVREVAEGDPLRFESRLLGFDHKRIHFYLEMFQAREGYLAATYEALSVHVDAAARRTAPMPESLSHRLGEVMQAHARLERPWQVGHVISLAPPPGR